MIGLVTFASHTLCLSDRQPVVLIALEFRFMGGSMGAVVGEKIAHAFEYAADEGLPMVAVTKW